MTKDEALKLALEALEVANSCVDGYYIPRGKTHLPEIELAITAIKEALANEALDKMAENARELGLDYEPEQEPVTCVEYIPCCTDQTCSKCKAATPPQRTWVGLTEREQGAIMEDLNAYGTNLYQFSQAIEAKLKEKNHG